MCKKCGIEFEVFEEEGCTDNRLYIIYKCGEVTSA